MKSIWTLAAVALLLACPPLPAADNPTSRILADASAKAPMLAFLTYTIDNDPPQTGGGQALCVESSGIFATYAVDNWMKSKNIKEASLLLSDGKSVKAKLLWVDPETGLGFFQTLEKGNFTAARFATEAQYTIGAQVASVGLLEDGNHTPYVTSAYISAVLRAPEPMVYVANGSLANEGSPVFDESGQVVGLVSPQPFKRFVTPTQQGQQELLLKGRQETSFFSPVSNFKTALDYLAKTPETPRLMPWIGALRLDALPSTDPRADQIKTPAIRLDTVIPDQNGDKAGLRNDDLIVGLNGKPFAKPAQPGLVVQNFQRELLRLGVGAPISLTIRRGSSDVEIKLQLDPVPPQPVEAPRYVSQPLGFAARDMVTTDRYTIDSAKSDKNARGVLVVGVGQRSPAYDAGLESNDLITEVNEKKIESVGDIKKLVDESLKTGPAKEIKLTVHRGSDPQGIKVITIQPMSPTTSPAQ